MTSRRKWLCLDCETDTGTMYEHYMLHDEVWLSVVETRSGMLCVGCIEKRLGRQLRPNDFNDSYINRTTFSQKSIRLLDRMGSP